MNSSFFQPALLAAVIMGLGPVVGQLVSAENFTNSLGMNMVRIEPGEFMMGSQEGDFDEQPAHRVRLTRPFFMGATEVSNAQYEQFDPSHRGFRGKMGFSHGDDEAVVFVSWHDAVRFCEWLGEKEGKPYRLPTEAEWEYAARAGTATPFHTGEELPEMYHKHQKQEWNPVSVSLQTGGTPPNAWGLHDMHGNVEEWCLDWYGPYTPEVKTNPIGRVSGDFRVTRGGSHNTPVFYLRSANRLGTLPEDKHWLIGFRVVQGELPETKPLEPVAAPLWGRNVSPARHDWPGGPGADQPFFQGPLEYVKIPPDSDGPMFSRHNHQPAISAAPNGDLLAVWYSCRTEAGRELMVVASRLRRGSSEWEPAAPFWDAPDRNDHGNAIWWDGQETLYHWNGLGTDGTWGKLALILRTSSDNGATWSKARLINPEHGLRNQVIAGAFRAQSGNLILACDAITGGNGGTAIHISEDGGETWTDPGAGKPAPEFAAGRTGHWIAGIHAGVVELNDGKLMALGRGDSIGGRMPKSISSDGGKTWSYSSSGLPPLGSGQRPVLLRLKEGPLFLASFAKEMKVKDSAGKGLEVSGLFGALSFDEGETWPVRRLITDGGEPREVDGGGNTRKFIMSPVSAEPRGYMAGTQTPDGVIQLISSKQHYAFNSAWLREYAYVAENDASQAPPPAPESAALSKQDLETRFRETMTGANLVGRWALVENGKLGEEKEDRYSIRGAAKIGEDQWVISARVQYGNRDVTVPIPVQVKWAGDTPVITITNMEIPLLGTYTARVVIHQDKYAGTWSGPNVSGLLHGVIRKGEGN
jgi:formylglycine-generating enzyme